MNSEITFACVLYQGEDVPSYSKGVFTEEWVDRLYRGINRNCNVPFRFVCFVDRDDYVFSEPVEVKKLEMPYRNMFCLLEPFREDMGRVVFMGLDTIIVGNIDWLARQRGPLTMLRDPYFPDRGCSGVMTFPYTPEVWKAFTDAHERHAQEQTMFGYASDMIFLGTVPHDIIEATDIDLPLADVADHCEAGEISRAMRPSRGGIYSYKAHCRNGLPRDACIVYFHGREKPHELFALDWVERHWGAPLVNPAQFTDALNNDVRVMLAQVKLNRERDLPWLKQGAVTDRPMIIVGGGPSLTESLPELVRLKQGGGVIFALNNTHDWLIARGIVPDYHVMLDSRIENLDFVRNPVRGVKYLISAFCHPEIFEALRDQDVTLWLNDMGGVEADGQILVCGGSTVGLKTMCLGHVMGFREQHLFGMDSSYSKGKHHAYEQKMNDAAAKTTVVANGETFLCDRWMAKQAVDFQPLVRMLEAQGCSIWVHGRGLIPWISKAMESPLTT